jgi:DNA-binding NarL/FixJ family response regulator
LVNALTPKEYAICIDIVNGMSNEEIANKNYVSLNTVKTHIKRIFKKLNLDSRMKLTSKLLRQN